MANSIASLFVTISADTKDFRREMASVQSTIQRTLGKEAMGASNVAAGLVAGVTAAFAGLGFMAIKSAADMEQNRIAFTTMLGSAEKAEVYLKALGDFAAKTPFNLPDVLQGSRRLLAMGFSAEQTIPILTAVGDAASGLGIGAEGINRITLALGQMQAKGKVSAEEMKQLSEAGIGAWGYLADAMGKSQAEVMKMAEQGQINSATALQTIISGMANQFPNMMEAQSQTIIGLMSTIEDNVGTVMRNVGQSLTDAFDLKSKLAGIGEWLDQFATMVESSGINEALRNMVPPEVAAEIFIIAGAVMAAAVPALLSLAAAAAAALVPLLPFIAVGAAIGAAMYLMWAAGVDVSKMFSGLGVITSAMYAKMAPTLEKIGQVAEKMGAVIVATLKVIMPIAAVLSVPFIIAGLAIIEVFGWLVDAGLWLWTAIADVVIAIADGWTWGMNQISSGFDFVRNLMPDWVKSMLDWIWQFVGPAIEMVNSVANALGNLFGKGGGAADTKKPEEKSGFESKNVHDLGLKGGGAAGGGKGGGKKGADPVKEAEKVTKQIADKWREYYQSEIGALNDWYKEMTDKLEKTKAANANYQQDITRLQQVFSIRRQQLVHDEMERMRSELDSLSDSFRDLKLDLNLDGLRGSEAVFADLDRNLQSQLEKIQDFTHQAQEASYKAGEALRMASASGDSEEIAKAQAHYDQITAIAIEAKNNELAYSEQATQNKLKREQEYILSGQQIEDDLTRLQNERNLQGYMEYLDAKTAATLSQIEGEQELMNTYREIQMEANRSMISYMAEATQVLYDGLSSAMAGIMTGAKSIQEAFKSLGKSVVNMIADFVAKRLAAHVLGLALNKQGSAQTAATAAATGAAVAASWAKAAAMTSLASFGANAAPAMAGIAATVGLATALSMPMLASGGITTGPTIAMIGEGKYDETVLPLSKRILSPIFAAAMPNGGNSESGTNAAVHLYGDIKTGQDMQEIINEFDWMMKRARK